MRFILLVYCLLTRKSLPFRLKNTVDTNYNNCCINSYHNHCNDHQHQTDNIHMTSNCYALYERKTHFIPWIAVQTSTRVNIRSGSEVRIDSDEFRNFAATSLCKHTFLLKSSRTFGHFPQRCELNCGKMTSRNVEESFKNSRIQIQRRMIPKFNQSFRVQRRVSGKIFLWKSDYQLYVKLPTDKQKHTWQANAG